MLTHGPRILQVKNAVSFFMSLKVLKSVFELVTGSRRIRAFNTQKFLKHKHHQNIISVLGIRKLDLFL